MKVMVVRDLWRDECGGFMNSAELVILGSILVLGVIPGATALRDAIVCEFADMAEAVNGGQPTQLDTQSPQGEGSRIAVASDLY